MRPDHSLEPRPSGGPPGRRGRVARLRPRGNGLAPQVPARIEQQTAQAAPSSRIRTMATPLKRAPPPKGKQPPRTPPSSSGSPSQPFLRFYHSEALRKKTVSLLGVIEQAEDGTVHRDALAKLVVELTNSGLDYFFMKQLKLAKPGFLVEQSANIGMAGVQQVMGSVIRQIIGRMDNPQLLSVCGSIRRLML